jgi:hypothetical protein
MGKGTFLLKLTLSLFPVFTHDCLVIMKTHCLFSLLLGIFHIGNLRGCYDRGCHGKSVVEFPEFIFTMGIMASDAQGARFALLVESTHDCFVLNILHFIIFRILFCSKRGFAPSLFF